LEAHYWSRDFLDQVESGPVSEGVELWATGGAGFIYRTPQTTVYIDPFFGTAAGHLRAIAIPINPEQVGVADIVLSTHRHVDHCHKESVVPIVRSTGALCAGPCSSARLLRQYGLRPDQIKELHAGDRFRVNDVEIMALPSHDPGEEHALCYLLRSGDISVFHGGDSHDCAQFTEVGEQFDIDLALLAFGRDHMDADELLTAATRLQPRMLVPYHWNLFYGYTRSPLELCDPMREMAPAFQVRIMLLGDRLSLRQEYGKDGEGELICGIGG